METLNRTDSAGNPDGGHVLGVGLEIHWQRGALIAGEPNGAFVETVIEAARQRLEYYQTTKFSCNENAAAIEHLEIALTFLRERQKRRAARGVAGTHEV